MLYIRKWNNTTEISELENENKKTHPEKFYSGKWNYLAPTLKRVAIFQEGTLKPQEKKLNIKINFLK